MCASTQARAALRRGLGLPVERCTYMHRYLVPWLRDHDDQHYGDVRRAYYAAAALIAARPARPATPHPTKTHPCPGTSGPTWAPHSAKPSPRAC
ncbi:type I-E CRISPR-associated protein Cse2/CasB [Streptomyces thermocarboxydus]